MTSLLWEFCKIPSQRQVVFCAGDSTFFQCVGIVRSKPRSTAEAEIISLDAGVRMEEFPAFTLWDCVLNVWATHSIHSTLATGNCSQFIFQTVDQVPSNTSPMFHLLLFEDNDAVLKMITKRTQPKFETHRQSASCQSGLAFRILVRRRRCADQMTNATNKWFGRMHHHSGGRDVWTRSILFGLIARVRQGWPSYFCLFFVQMVRVFVWRDCFYWENLQEQCESQTYTTKKQYNKKSIFSFFSLHLSVCPHRFFFSSSLF